MVEIVLAKSLLQSDSLCVDPFAMIGAFQKEFLERFF